MHVVTVLTFRCQLTSNMTNKMKEQITIGFDAKRIVRNGTGLGSYGRTLVNDLATFSELNLRLYAPDAGRDDLRQQVPERNNLHYAYPQTKIFKSYWRSHGIVSQLQQEGIQVYHGLSGELPIGIRKAGIKTVVTIHDLIFLRHPEYYNWIDVQIYKHKFFQTLREADSIVAISECTRRDIVELGGVDPTKIELIYQSCASRFKGGADERVKTAVRLRYCLPERYILSVGSIEERKNAMLAVKALCWLPEDVHLVLVGRPTAYTRKVEKLAQQEHLSHRLHLLHGVPDIDLPALYEMAEVFVYPSRYEGFGIPIIEAVRMGLPVVACTGSCLEEAGGPDNLYVDPNDAQGMASAIGKLMKGNEGRERRIALSQQYITRFENNDAAQRFVQLYHHLLH